jgi:hypothetical protein
MEETLLKQRKELQELRVDNANAYQAKNEIQRQANHRHVYMDVRNFCTPSPLRYAVTKNPVGSGTTM